MTKATRKRTAIPRFRIVVRKKYSLSVSRSEEGEYALNPTYMHHFNVLVNGTASRDIVFGELTKHYPSPDWQVTCSPWGFA